ncbi:MAG TPA: ABC transporter permease [Tepidisphaeraceae bacterium]|nr:ABC transporter permease [Tepidisphaeraceae bacterium]
MAAPAGLKEGDVVRIGGIDVQVAGLFDAARFDREVRALSGEPIAPLKFEANLLDAGGRQMSDASAESLDLNANAAGRELGATYEYLPAQDFAIVPASLSRLLPNAALRSVAVRAADSAAGGARADADVKLLADELARRFAVALFAGYSDGVRMVSAGNLSSVSGAGQVAIPLAIAGLIIFNTMLGSIAERRREIHVYTSLGLAPLHVGALFVAEAMVYGLIGVVFGYVIGQGAGTLLLKLGLLGSGVTLNYSGTSAMMTMGLILLIVLASSIVPARMAARVAAPSIERSWRVPGPRDGQIEADLPFTINRTAADGAIAYLAEFFAAHREGSIGKFSADRIEAFSGPGYARGNGDGDANRGNVVLVDTAPGPGMSAVGDGANRAAPAGAASLTHGPNSSGNGDRGGAAAPAANGNAGRGLRTIVWLTPFDLGVRQELTLVIRPGEHPDIYEVRVTLRRLSGDDGSWYRMNRPFLTELRRQFLRWRSLSSEQMLDYVAASRRLFAEGQAR